MVGRAFLPAGFRRSRRLSPTFSSTGSIRSRSVSSVELRESRDIRILFSSTRSTFARRRRLEHLGLSIGFSGSSIVGHGISKDRGSVITPVIAEAAAVSGLTRQTLSSCVPDRPGKLRGTVRRLIFSEAGACPMPMQPLQPA